MTITILAFFPYSGKEKYHRKEYIAQPEAYVRSRLQIVARPTAKQNPATTFIKFMGTITQCKAEKKKIIDEDSFADAKAKFLPMKVAKKLETNQGLPFPRFSIS